jgi:bifunctional non-homologous end joining protein LigD
VGSLGFVEPQLATLVDTVPDGDDWLHEAKLDGYRVECLIGGGAARMITRNGNDWTARFAGLAAAAARLPVERAILDGEVVALLPEGRSSFQLLQQRLGEPGGELVFYAFDLLHQDGENLRPLPQLERKARLRRLLGRKVRGKGPIRYSDHVLGGGAGVLAEACRLGLEGVISKRADAPYQGGRTRSWLKIKCLNRQEFIVVGFTEPRGGRIGLGALLLAVRDDRGALRYAGKVGTGMGDAMLGEVRRELEALVRRSPPVDNVRGVAQAGVHWVEPRLVAEVSFTEWTHDGRLRHPAFMGMRRDKLPRQVRREDPMNVAGVVLSNPDRVLFPEQGLTKRDLAAYYEAIAPLMLPHVADRPLSLVRCPEGRTKSCFFQKHWGRQLPEGVRSVDIRESSGETKPYAVVRDATGLVALVQHGVLEFHLWGARADQVESPDRIIFDLDPDPSVPWKRVQEAALALRTLLQASGLESWLKTTGGKGLHVVVPIARRSTWDEVSGFARAVAYHFAGVHPEQYLARASKAARKGKIFVDWLRNTRGATAVAPWSSRAREGAPVSVPVGWEELPALKRGDPFHVTDVLTLVQRRKGKDPWSAMAASRQRLTRAMTAKLEG